MLIVVQKQNEWMGALKWLMKHGPKSQGKAERVRGMLECMDWGSDVTALGALCPKENLVRLLSDNWIDDEIINMSMNDIAARVYLDPVLSKTTAVATLALQNEMEKAFKSGDYSACVLLNRLAEEFKEGKHRRWLYFPAHVNQNHWVAMLIDFEAKMIWYGE